MDHESSQGAAKTGQSLIASSTFASLPEVPAKAEPEGMDIDSHGGAAETEKAADGAASKSATAPRKNAGPVDPVTHDLLPEGIAYLRLLIILAALDAGRVDEVSFFVLLSTSPDEGGVDSSR